MRTGMKSISLSSTVGPEIPNDMETWTKVVLSQVFLTVSTRRMDTGDPLDYLWRLATGSSGRRSALGGVQ
jgi:hypothetical protein